MQSSPVLFVLALAGCAGGGPIRQPPIDTDSDSQATGTDSGADTDTDTAPPVELVDVSHERELRGAWVATVYNINFPSSQNLTPAQARQELADITSVLADCGFNAIFFQVRPEGDALYDSDLEPWSRYLTGTQGQDPGYDPLTVLIEEAHPRGLEVHAWLNPYRAKASSSSTAAAPHLSKVHPEYTYTYGGGSWYDPGSVEVRKRLVDVVGDLVDRYPIDGIHFDDYFYPYPVSGVAFPDNSTWSAYTSSGGTLSRADWRRQNVHDAMRDVHNEVSTSDDSVRFGISPFGIYRPGQPAGVVGFDQYEGLYSDPLVWMNEGWVDYLAPQLYWPTTRSGQPYEALLQWWAQQTKGGRYIFAGNYLSKLASASDWSLDEFRQQVQISRASSADGSGGNIFFQVEPLMADRDGARGLFRDELYTQPALSPPLAHAIGTTVSPPTVTELGGMLTLAHTDAAPLRGFTVYEDVGGTWTLRQIVPSSSATVQVAPGRWAVAAATRHGVESQGVVVTVSAP